MATTLSICIASYNKAETTYTLVNRLLTCNNPEMEVVVVDNASTDNTIEKLKTITDDRLRVVSHEKNIGAAPNILASIYAGAGDYCLYTNDRDIIIPEKLDGFISYLNNNPTIGGGHCVRNKLNVESTSVVYQGVNALLNINFRDEHPTGYFFKRSLLSLIPVESLEKYGHPKGYASFVWENLLCEIICMNKEVAQYNDVIWRSTGNTSSANYRSGYAKMDDLSDRWFYPGNCLRRAIGNTEDTLRLVKEKGISLTDSERYQMYANLLGSEFRYAVYRYKVIFETPNLAFHYKVPLRKISKKEVYECRREFFDGYLEYIRRIEGGPNELENYLTDRIKKMDKEHRLTIRGWLSKIKNNIINRLASK